MTFPLALYSEPWKILTLVIDSIDFPSMGLMTLYRNKSDDCDHFGQKDDNFHIVPSLDLSSDKIAPHSPLVEV